MYLGDEIFLAGAICVYMGVVMFFNRISFFFVFFFVTSSVSWDSI